MILTKDGQSYWVVGTLDISGATHVVTRSFDGGRLKPAILHDTAHVSVAKAVREAESLAKLMVRQGWRPSSVEVFRASMGDTTGRFDPFVGFVPLPGESGRIIEKERKAAVKAAEIKRQQELALEELKLADSKAAAAKAEAERRLNEVAAAKATEARIAQLAATDVARPVGSIEASLYTMKKKEPAKWAVNDADRKALADAAQYDADVKAAVKSKVDAEKDRMAKEAKLKEDMGEASYSTYVRFKNLELD